jgi:hypothetical protein
VVVDVVAVVGDVEVAEGSVCVCVCVCVGST